MSNDLSRMTHIYSGNPLDRGDHERRDEEWLSASAKAATSKFLPLWENTVMITEGSDQSLGWLDITDITRLGIEVEGVFLGLRDGAAYFTVDITKNEHAVKDLKESGDWAFEDTRAVTGLISATDSGIVAQARAQINWHNRHGFCSVCGHPTEMKKGGHVRRCGNCNTQHFPRTDPVVITAVSDGDRLLLGQSKGRLQAMNRYSVLAGFIDQGESIEEAVQREIMEESGIQVRNVRYHSSQPWPFPSTLMIGCHADAATSEITMDEGEMTDVRWFTRKDVLSGLAGTNENLALPGSIAIAYHLITAWAKNDVP
ncbi:MAG: NAD(+) diphosphatase [Chloroflexi bacterium]|nr:NAD(+) diphosphatase [Chloroflexota bacterium]